MTGRLPETVLLGASEKRHCHAVSRSCERCGAKVWLGRAVWRLQAVYPVWCPSCVGTTKPEEVGIVMAGEDFMEGQER